MATRRHANSRFDSPQQMFRIKKNLSVLKTKVINKFKLTRTRLWFVYIDGYLVNIATIAHGKRIVNSKNVPESCLLWPCSGVRWPATIADFVPTCFSLFVCLPTSHCYMQISTKFHVKEFDGCGPYVFFNYR